MTPEEKATKTINEELKSVTIGGTTYTAKPATLATLIEVGAIASTIPTDDEQGGEETAIAYTLRNAREASKVTSIIATLIIGIEPQRERKGLKGILIPRRLRNAKETKNRRQIKELTHQLNKKLTPSTAYKALIDLLPLMEIEHFFALSTFLHQMNTIPARKVEEETTLGA